MELLLNALEEEIHNEVFNVGYENMSIIEIAQLVKQVVGQEFPQKDDIQILTTPSDDNRSFYINSDKIKRVLDFQPKYSIEKAIRDLCHAFKDGKLPNSFDDDFYFNVKRLKRLQAI